MKELAIEMVRAAVVAQVQADHIEATIVELLSQR